MKTIIIITLIYIVTVIVSFYSNKYGVKKFGFSAVPELWFMPILNILALLAILQEELSECKMFQGDYWEERWK